MSCDASLLQLLLLLVRLLLLLIWLLSVCAITVCITVIVITPITKLPPPVEDAALCTCPGQQQAHRSQHAAPTPVASGIIIIRSQELVRHAAVSARSTCK
jgi:hypothetical protein